MAKFNGEAFAKDLRKARDLTRPLEAEDRSHLAKLEFWTTCLGVIGLALAARGCVSPMAMIFVGGYKFGKFAILAHHSLHGAWGRDRRRWFAQSFYRRISDWMDWIFPEAWIAEHNKIHHYALCEDADPDFLQRHAKDVREMEAPVALKYLMVVGNAVMWKWWYYASNTLKLLHADRAGSPSKLELEVAITMTSLVAEAIKGDPWYQALALDFFVRVMAPPFFLQFAAIPMLLGLLFHGILFSWAAFVNVIGAEIVTNVWAFCTIVTNHAGADLWCFDCPCTADTPEFYIRSVLGSAAYHAGNDVIDYCHGFQNYQAAHHCFPELSPLHYQRLLPALKLVCLKHGIPFVQEPVWVRTKKTADIIIGKASHKSLKGYAVDQPEAWIVSK